MKATFFTTFALAALALVSAAPTEEARSVNSLLQSRDACSICDGIGPSCIAACIAGGEFDPVCDFCAPGEIWECIDVSIPPSTSH